MIIRYFRVVSTHKRIIGWASCTSRRMSLEATAGSVSKTTQVSLCWSNLQRSQDALVYLKPSSGNDRHVGVDRPDDVVLQYQRQMLKFQHAQKAGQPVENLQTIYRDEDVCIVYKPPDILTVPGVHSRCCLLDAVHQKYGKNCENPIHMVVHRLDMCTSGLVLFGRNLQTTKQLQALFRQRETKKLYQALVVGHLPECGGDFLIDLPLQKDHENPPFMRVATPNSEIAAVAAVAYLQSAGWKKLVAKKAKASQTRVKVIERGIYENSSNLPYTRVLLEPITGRTHQLRVHMAALGFPIVGDSTYGLYGEASMRGGLLDLPTDGIDQGIRPSLAVLQSWNSHYAPNEKPMCLHATKLGLEHPRSRKWMEWEMPPTF